MFDHILRTGVIITLLCYIFFFAFLFFADGFYDILNKGVTFILRRDNHFSGETWFSAVASSVTAIPGIYCGVLALLQTKRLHDLEARYHRPALGFQGAGMKVAWIRDMQYSEMTADYHRDRFVECIKRKDPWGTKANLMTFSLDIEIKNDIGVTDIIPEQIEFIFRNETYTVNFYEIVDEWKQYRTCRPDYNRDRYLFHISWELFPYCLKGSRDQINTEEKDTETRFWESIELFTNFENRCDRDYFSLLTKIFVKVYYEYAPAEYNMAVGTISWTADDGAGRYKAVAERRTHSGIFTYRDTV